MKYKLICMDMDGTLLNDKKEVSERSIKAIEKAHNLGVKVVIATGRIFVSAEFYGDIIGVKAPIISSNGACVRERDGEKAIYEENLGCENYELVLSLLKKYDIVPHFYTDDTIYTERIIHSSLSYKNANKTLPQNRQIKIKLVNDWNKLFIEERPKIIKAMAVDLDGKRIKEAKAEFVSLNKFQIVSSFKNSFEIMAKETSKGNALKKICDYYGIARNEIISIGDNENDISMIRFAGLGVAMGNAESVVKEIADYITLSNEEDGVAKVIEEFIIKEVFEKKIVIIN